MSDKGLVSRIYKGFLQPIIGNTIKESRFEQTLHQRRCTNGQHASGKDLGLGIVSHLGNEPQVRSRGTRSTPASMAEMIPAGLGEDVEELERSYTLGGGVYGGVIT